jgi:hypothetical protein
MARKRRKPDEIVAKLRRAARCPSPCSRYGHDAYPAFGCCPRGFGGVSPDLPS